MATGLCSIGRLLHMLFSASTRHQGTMMTTTLSIPDRSAHGCTMPAIGFGTSQLGDCGELVATALKIGYRHIDTAWKYGSEKGVGEGMRASGVPRKDVFL